jgi:hypothetical protein
MFARVDYKILENNRRDRNDKHEFDGEQVVYLRPSGAVKNARTGAAEPPRLLGESQVPLDPQGNPLRQLAEWLTSPENSRFNQMQANRIWYHLMGRGLVDPIDDFRATNPPSNPRLLDALTQDFVASGYDMRHLIRTIMTSQTYQLSSEPNQTNADDERNFSRTMIRRLTAEQLLDSLSRAVDVPLEFNGYPDGLRAGQLPGVQAVRPRDRRLTVRKTAAIADLRVRAFRRSDAGTGVSTRQRHANQRPARCGWQPAARAGGVESLAFVDDRGTVLDHIEPSAHVGRTYCRDAAARRSAPPAQCVGRPRLGAGHRDGVHAAALTANESSRGQKTPAA